MTMDTKQDVGNPLQSILELSDAEKQTRGLVYTPAEIAQQPQTWRKTYADLCAQREALKKFLAPRVKPTTTVYLVGAGTSDYTGRALASILRQQWRCEVLVVPSTELISSMKQYVLPGREYLWISSSRSGDSSEGVGVLELAFRDYPQVQHVVLGCNREGKMPQLCAGRENAYVLMLDDATNDRSLAMTSSFTNMLIAGHCLAHLDSLDAYGKIVDGLVAIGAEMLQKVPSVAETMSNLRCRKFCFVGSGVLAVAATECSLKTLELTAGTIATMAESTLGLRHGPLSALDDDSLFVAFISSEELRWKYERDLLAEIHAKGLGRARVAISPRKDAEIAQCVDEVVLFQEGLNVPDDYRVPAMVIFGQVLGLFSSMKAGLQPDRPSPNGAINRVVSHVQLYL